MGEPAPITFRTGTEQDAGDIIRLTNMATDHYLEKSWQVHAGPNETWMDVGKKLVLDPQHPMHVGWTVVAEHDGKVVGMLNAYPMKMMNFSYLLAYADPIVVSYAKLQSQQPEGFYLANMAVYEEFRGQGIARHLLDMVIGVAFRLGYPQIVATVHSTKTELLAHYDRRGMKIVDQLPLRLNDQQPEDSLLYLLTLENPKQGD